MKWKWLTALRVLCPAVLLISAMALGIELLVRGAENLTAVYVWGVIALTALSGNGVLAGCRLFSSGKKQERQIALLVILFTLGVYAGGLIRIFS